MRISCRYGRCCFLIEVPDAVREIDNDAVLAVPIRPERHDRSPPVLLRARQHEPRLAVVVAHGQLLFGEGARLCRPDMAAAPLGPGGVAEVSRRLRLRQIFPVGQQQDADAPRRVQRRALRSPPAGLSVRSPQGTRARARESGRARATAATRPLRARPPTRARFPTRSHRATGARRRAPLRPRCPRSHYVRDPRWRHPRRRKGCWRWSQWAGQGTPPWRHQAAH